jgi:predicted RNA binding protein YcfA (HicA-like mRNA interferase family)
MSGRDVRKILEEQGFVLVRQRGSHIVMQRAIPGSTITAVVPDHAELRVGTLQSVIRQSQLPRTLFEIE